MNTIPMPQYLDYCMSRVSVGKLWSLAIKPNIELLYTTYLKLLTKNSSEIYPVHMRSKITKCT